MSEATRRLVRDAEDRIQGLITALPAEGDTPRSALAAKLRGHLESEQARLARTTPRVVVIGRFKSGKSTLINALLGVELLPRADLPTTAVVTSIVHGPTYGTRIAYRSGEELYGASKRLRRYMAKNTSLPDPRCGLDPVLAAMGVIRPDRTVDTSRWEQLRALRDVQVPSAPADQDATYEDVAHLARFLLDRVAFADHSPVGAEGWWIPRETVVHGAFESLRAGMDTFVLVDTPGLEDAGFDARSDIQAELRRADCVVLVLRSPGNLSDADLSVLVPILTAPDRTPVIVALSAADELLGERAPEDRMDLLAQAEERTRRVIRERLDREGLDQDDIGAALRDVAFVPTSALAELERITGMTAHSLRARARGQVFADHATGASELLDTIRTRISDAARLQRRLAAQRRLVDWAFAEVPECLDRARATCQRRIDRWKAEEAAVQQKLTACDPAALGERLRAEALAAFERTGADHLRQVRSDLGAQIPQVFRSNASAFARSCSLPWSTMDAIRARRGTCYPGEPDQAFMRDLYWAVFSPAVVDVPLRLVETLNSGLRDRADQALEASWTDVRSRAIKAGVPSHALRPARTALPSTPVRSPQIQSELIRLAHASAMHVMSAWTGGITRMRGTGVVQRMLERLEQVLWYETEVTSAYFSERILTTLGAPTLQAAHRTALTEACRSYELTLASASAPMRQALTAELQAAQTRRKQHATRLRHLASTSAFIRETWPDVEEWRRSAADVLRPASMRRSTDDGSRPELR